MNMDFVFEEEQTEIAYDSVDDFFTGFSLGLTLGSVIFCC